MRSKALTVALLSAVTFSVSAICAAESPALASAGDVASVTPESYRYVPKGEQSGIDGRYAEVPSGDSFGNYSALGETPGPGGIVGSRAFIYVNGTGLHANYAQVGWRGYFDPKSPWPPNVCNGSFDIQWTDAQGHHQERHGNSPNCTIPPQFNIPGHYISFDLNNDTFKANTDVCGRYTINGETSPWACIEMKP